MMDSIVSEQQELNDPSTSRFLDSSVTPALSTFTVSQNIKEDFIPFLSERSANGRIKIESVQNLVTRVGALSGIQKAVEQGRQNYLAIKENTVNKNSLRGMGVVRKQQAG